MKTLHMRDVVPVHPKFYVISYNGPRRTQSFCIYYSM